MFRRVVKTVLGDPVERALAKYRTEVEKINALEPQMQALSETQMRQKSDELRARLQNGAQPDDVLHEAFALVREAAVRTIGLRHYDVQLIGGMVLHEGRIAEMKTGEGKTLVATLPLYLNGLLGRGRAPGHPQRLPEQGRLAADGADLSFIGSDGGCHPERRWQPRRRIVPV
jgi:preprotein translocase subunit SecA